MRDIVKNMVAAISVLENVFVMEKELEWVQNVKHLDDAAMNVKIDILRVNVYVFVNWMSQLCKNLFL